MNDNNEVLLIIVTVLLSLFIIICTAVAIAIFKLISVVRRVAEKAEDVIDSVESAAEVFKDTQGRLAFFKLVSNIFKMVQKRSRKWWVAEPARNKI